MNEHNRLKIFLCHASEDKNKVYELYERLSKEGYDLWLDRISLLPGQDWQHEIKKAVQDTHMVIVCLTKNSINKEGFIQREISYALDIAELKPQGTIYIVPVRLEKCNVPQRLSRWQYVDFYESDGYKKILSSILRRMETIEYVDIKTVQKNWEIARVMNDLQTFSKKTRLEHLLDVIKWGRLLIKYQDEEDEIKKEIFRLFQEEIIKSFRYSRFIGNTDATIEDELEVANELIETIPEKTAIWHHRAQIRVRKRDYEGALYDYTKAIEINPSKPDLWEARANFFERIGKDDTALKDLSKAIEVANDEGKFLWYEKRSDFHKKKGSYSLTLKDLSDAINACPTAEGGYIIILLLKRLEILLEHKKYKEALIDYESILRHETDDPNLMLSSLIGKLQIEIVDSPEDFDYTEIRKDISRLANVVNELDYYNQIPNPSEVLLSKNRESLQASYLDYSQQLWKLRISKSIFSSILEKGGLSLFPATAQNISFESFEGDENSHTTSFCASFTDTRQNIQEWINESPGINKVQRQNLSNDKVKYSFTSDDSTNTSEVTIDFSLNKVNVYVSWIQND